MVHSLLKKVLCCDPELLWVPEGVPVSQHAHTDSTTKQRADAWLVNASEGL